MDLEAEKKFWDELEILREQHWLSPSASAKGDLKFQGHLRFAGQWSGSIEGSGEESVLHVMKGAVVRGQIQCQCLQVDGTIEEAQIQVEHLHARAGCRIRGSIEAKKIVMDDGAVIEGSFKR